MKILITAEEKSALELMERSTISYDVCKKLNVGKIPCKKCPLDAFEPFKLCDRDDASQQAKEILAVAELYDNR